MLILPFLRAGVVAAFCLIASFTCGAGFARAQDAGSGERTLSVRGVERSYIVHVPPSAGHAMPLVFVFHGGGGRSESIERVTGMDSVADQNGFVAVYPAGEPGPSGRGGTWNVGGGVGRSSADDVGFVRAILRDLARSVPIDPSRIYATGHSMGGVFAYRLACEMSGTFAAIAPVSATMVEGGCHPRSPVAVLHIHGTADDRIPLEGGAGDMTAPGRSWPAPQRGISAWVRFDGCAGQPAQRADIGTCTSYGQCRAPVDFCVIPGGGHPWPAGAAERIWAFFAANPKR